MASLYAKCPKCDYLNDRYINEPTPLEMILVVLEREHLEKSPDCAIKVTELLIANPDPNSSYHTPGTTRMVRVVHLERNKEKTRPIS